MGPRRVAALAAWLLGFGLLWDAGAQGAVPQRDRIEKAIAKTNASAGRGQAMQIDVLVQIGDRPAVARGELLTDPSGRARLEIRGAGNLVERHLWQGRDSQAARNGEIIVEPRPFLPPVFVLQASSGEGLRNALLSLEVDPAPLGLVECGEEDCLVLGDPEQDIPAPAGPPLAGLEEYEFEKAQAQEAREAQYERARVWFWAGADGLVFASLDAEAESLRLEALAEAEADPEALPPGVLDPVAPRVIAGWNGDAQVDDGTSFPQDGLLESVSDEDGSRLEEESETLALLPPSSFEVDVELPPAASVWVSRDNYEIRGLETAAGARVELGPLASYGSVFFPAWIQIEEAGQEPIRLEIQAARRIEVQPETFSQEWLLTPEEVPRETEQVPASGL